MNFSNIGTIFKRELNSYFNSATAYVFIVVFLAILSWFYVNNTFLIGVASLRPMFEVIPLIFLFIIPAITMRLLSEEKRSGTIELITTKPVADYEIIFAKFFAAWALIAVAVLPTVLYWVSIASIGDLDNGPVIGGYIGIMLMAAVYISIGLFASSLTDNQVVAFIIGFLIMLVFFLFDKILIYLPLWAVTTVEYIGVDYHFASIAKGVIDTRNLIYFFSVIGFALYLSVVSLDRRKW